MKTYIVTLRDPNGGKFSSHTLINTSMIDTRDPLIFVILTKDIDNAIFQLFKTNTKLAGIIGLYYHIDFITTRDIICGEMKNSDQIYETLDEKCSEWDGVCEKYRTDDNDTCDVELLFYQNDKMLDVLDKDMRDILIKYHEKIAKYKNLVYGSLFDTENLNFLENHELKKLIKVEKELGRLTVKETIILLL